MLREDVRDEEDALFPRLQEAVGPEEVLDRSRDLIDAGVRRVPDQLVPAGRAVSKALAGLAGLVERIPLSRAGDEPPTGR